MLLTLTLSAQASQVLYTEPFEGDGDVNSAERFSDFNADGAVDFLDYSAIAGTWLSELGEPDFNEIYDLDDDNDVDANDLSLFAQDWLAGVKYPYVPGQTNRHQINFNTDWRFYRGSVPGDAARLPAFDDSSWQQVLLPHNPPRNPPDPDPLRPCWNDPGGYHYEGVSWYRKHFTLSTAYQAGKVFIEFEAINTVADVWINGTHLKTHYGGYLPFTVDITDHAYFGATENVIAVKADNTDNPDVPIGNAGWFNWGGIYRDVRLHITDRLHVTDAVDANIVAGGGVFVTYPSVSESRALLRVKTHIVNEYATAKTCTVASYVVDANDMVVAKISDTNTIPAGSDYTFIQSANVYQPNLWHPDSPYLYTLYTEVCNDNNGLDSYRTRIGIRSIDFTREEG
ncbi:MAG: beta galactosidase jelly roll domain-containing protein, partial [Planctomycetota bacterium]